MKYIRLASWRVFKYMLSDIYPDKRIGIFRNMSHIKPGRWGFFILGFEVGSRNPRDKVGVWLKSQGLWPW